MSNDYRVGFSLYEKQLLALGKFRVFPFVVKSIICKFVAII